MSDNQMRTDDARRTSQGAGQPSAAGWFAALAVVLVLLGLGLANIYVRATWREVEDGVLWVKRAQGVTAAEIAAGTPAIRAGMRVGDVLLAIDGQPVDSPADVVTVAHRASAGTPFTYTLLRLGTREVVQVRLAPIPQGNSVLYFVLAAVGIFTLIVGAGVRLRRPGDQSSLHFFWLTVAFFGVFTFSFSGRFDRLDWLFYWSDTVALLALAPMLLHFTLVFPDRSGSWVRTPAGARLLPLVYLPALLMGTGRILAVAGLRANAGLLSAVAWLDRVEPLYLGLCLLGGFAVLVHALAHVRSVTARRQLRWIVWGTLLGGAPFTLGYALPFALGTAPSVRMELLAIPLGLVPLAFASAIVRYRLMDVEVIVKRGLVYVAAVSAIVAVYAVLLRVIGWFFGGQAGGANAVIAILSTLVLVLLARPMKEGIQNVLDRAFYRDRYDYRRALVGFARDLSTDLDLQRLSERLVARITETLVIDRMSLMLVDDQTGGFRSIRAVGFVGDPPPVAVESGVGLRVAGGHTVAFDDPLTQRRLASDEIDAWRGQGVHYLIPCVSKQHTIAVLALGRKERGEPLSSEDMALVVAVAAQVATALENGRLYQQLRAQADQVERMRQFNENILESLDNGLVVVDARGRVVRWNQALSRLCAVTPGDAIGRSLDELLSSSLVDALRAARRDHPLGTVLYRVPLVPARGRADTSLLVNIAIVPLQGDRAGAPSAGSILVFEDVTARARLEEQLQISDKMASIGLLAAGVAHEVNTPLTGISSYTQMLLDRADPDDPRTKLLEKIERQTFRAAKIVNGLLTLARGGQAPDERAPVDINVVINDVLSLLEHQLKGVNIQVRRDLAPVPPVVYGMEHKLQQVFLNLFINARDAMPKGGWLSVGTRTAGDAVVVEVGDTGVGIHAEHLSRIYDPFFTTKELGQGTGLGLSITYGIVGEHNGTMSCDSRPGEGTRFTLRLPLVPAAQRAAAAGASPAGS
ncbi:MAG: ATP-binding protein [Acidobacteria bacterium]|nr:ATP-binding protein [Acidobacteriota bacterium]